MKAVDLAAEKFGGKYSVIIFKLVMSPFYNPPS